METDYKKKIAAFIKANKYLILSFVFMYIAPLIMLIILACEGKSADISIKLWGAVIGFIMIITYIAKIKKWMHDKKQEEKIEQLKVPVYLRVLQLFFTGVGFTCVFLVLATIKQMFDEILVYAICSCVSVCLANVFLIVDSKNRVAHKIKRD